MDRVGARHRRTHRNHQRHASLPFPHYGLSDNSLVNVLFTSQSTDPDTKKLNLMRVLSMNGFGSGALKTRMPPPMRSESFPRRPPPSSSIRLSNRFSPTPSLSSDDATVTPPIADARREKLSVSPTSGASLF